ncbi:concanavalin A-like lectin/glucanase domain-containing protein [Xylaria intraflava]|nr:concanavalin A-like lectin/glucanase domain-containing protein [Xylaria intraflava]
MAPRGTLLKTTALSLASLASLTQGRPLTDARDDCGCYKAAADSTAYFANRKFFDFRNIGDPATPGPITAGAAADMAAGATHPYFKGAEWTGTWSTQSWDTPGEGVHRVNSANNVLVAPGDGGKGTCLTLRTERQASYQSTAEVESVAADYHFLTMRMYARTTGSAGAVTALFTYTGKTDPVQEADLEIRTLTDPSVAQYTNQPGTVDGDVDKAATRVVDLPSPWTDWHEYRYDWTPGSSDWFVDGAKVASIQHNAPTVPLSVIMNVWSDGGSWSGVMDVGKSAAMQVQWLDLTYNSTSQPGAGACSSVCVIDDLI